MKSKVWSRNRPPVATHGLVLELFWHWSKKGFHDAIESP